MVLKWLIGLANFSLSFFAILLNLLIFLPVFRLAFVSRKSTIYIIAFFNILADLLQLSITCFHLSASIMADRYILATDRLGFQSVLLGGLFMSAWYMECLVQIVMAVNRFTVITLNNKTFFTFTSTIIIFILIICITTFSAICMQYIFPCCRFIIDQNAMSYLQVEVKGLYNYSNALLLFYNVSCTSISILCYMSVWLSIVFISFFYVLNWILFEILFPHIVPKDQPEWNAIVPILVSCNCSSNSIIYLAVNPEVQKNLQVLCIRDKLVRGSVSKTAAVVNPPINPTT